MSRMPTTVRIGAFFAVVGALAVALYVTLPTEPTSVVSGTDMVADLLSSDGTYFTGGFYTSEIGGHQCASLKVWDARTGAERGDYFRKLIAALYVVHDGVPIGQVGDPDQRGFTLADIRYSHDRRYCVLLHRRGLALADLQEGREWQTAVPLDIVLDPDPGVNKIVRQLDRRIDEHLLQHAAEKKTKWKEALSLWKAIARCQFPVVVDRKAIAAAAKRDEDPDEVEVKFPVWTARSSAGNVLEDLISQLSGGTADYFVRSDHIEITTKKEKHKSRILLPTFSPLGTFIVLPMIAADKGKLHVVECATGTLIATLPMHLNVQWQNIHFTPDDELLCFPAADRSALIVWDTKSRQTLRTIDGIGIGHDPLAPDGVTMLLNGGAEIVNLRTGVRRPFIEGQVLDKLFHSFVFSPDSKAVLRHLAAELEVWDVGTGKKRGVIEGGPIQKGGLARITPDSQIYCVLTRDDPPIIAWNLDSCRRLWPAKQPMPDVGIVVSSITVRDDSWVFTPNSSFIVHRNRLSIDAIDLATGEVQSSLTLGSDATPDFQSPSSGYVRSFTPDGQWMVSVWDCPASGLQEWLSQWLPLRKSSRSVVVSELATGRIVLTLRPSHVLGNTMLSDDGRVLMTSTFRGDECTVRCWDVPGRPALRYVLGIPAGIGCGVLLILWWLRIRRAS